MNSYDTKTWAWEAQINALKSELEVQAAENRKLRAALEEAASPAFLRPLVEEQSAGEWYEETIDKDVDMFSAAIRALIPE